MESSHTDACECSNSCRRGKRLRLNEAAQALPRATGRITCEKTFNALTPDRINQASGTLAPAPVRLIRMGDDGGSGYLYACQE